MGDLRAHFEDLAVRWDSLQPPDRGEVLRRLLAPFAPLLGASRSILEVGTGTGALIPCLRERAPGAHVVSVDLAGEMLRRARQRCPAAAVVQADAHRPPFATAAFDLVVCHNSFPHFADKPAALSGLARALQPGGHLLILHDLSREKVNAIHSGGGPAIQHDLLPPGEETEWMLARAGFVDVWVEDTDTHYVAVGRKAGSIATAPQASSSARISRSSISW
jgi:demethylmenaquinone methyltransferase/2-methoxy-6-polyprenyl-1,4-benzoquinol methylase